MSVIAVPAGTEAYVNRTVQLFIKNQPNKSESTEFGVKFKRWRTYEKTVTEITSSKKGTNLMPDSYDVVIPIFSASFVQACGTKIVLANPEVGKDYDKKSYSALGIKSIVDSGGFQMLRGNVDFVSPDAVIARYNENADIGMPLDLPTKSRVEASYFDAVSHMIKANDEYIMKRLNPGIDLALISHGSCVERRKARLDVLDRKAKVVAIAGLGTQPHPGVDKILASVENLMYVVSRYHKTTEYFHVLGVTSKLFMFLYSLLDQAGYVKSIGADSVSHRVSALAGIFETHDFQQIKVTKNQVYKQSPICNCPICSAIDDMRIVQSWRILEAHNLWVRSEQVRFLGQLAKGYLNGQVKLSEIHSLLNLNMTINKFTTIVTYIQDVMAGGYRPMRKLSNTKGLVGIGKAKLTKDPHYEAVLANYEKFHNKKFPRKI